jgi:hypothetical protein
MNHPDEHKAGFGYAPPVDTKETDLRLMLSP